MEEITKSAGKNTIENFKKFFIERFNNMGYFNTIDDIPDVPITDEETYNNIIIPNLIRCGAIPKNKLIKGKTYIGACRNSSEATWLGNKFEYERYKFGTRHPETINHFQDDDGYDVFVPIKEK